MNCWQFKHFDAIVGSTSRFTYIQLCSKTRLGDIKEADIAGVTTVAVTWGVHDRKYFAREEHLNVLGIVDTVAELKDFIYS